VSSKLLASARMLFLSGVDYPPPGERVMRHPDRNINGDISALSFRILSKTLRPVILLVHPRGQPGGHVNLRNRWPITGSPSVPIRERATETSGFFMAGERIYKPEFQFRSGFLASSASFFLSFFEELSVRSGGRQVHRRLCTSPRLVSASTLSTLRPRTRPARSRLLSSVR
jgi:hypothetical protein